MGRTVVHGDYEWDEEKAKINIKKHGISFEEAIIAFDDPHFTEICDFLYSEAGEVRIKGIGTVHDFVIVTTIFVERKRTRIISARIADKDEEELYYERKYGYYGRESR